MGGAGYGRFSMGQYITTRIRFILPGMLSIINTTKQ